MISVASASGRAMRLTAGLIMLGFSATSARAEGDRLSEILSGYGCQVTGMLSAIQQSPRSVATPFLMVAVTDKVAKQINCSFVEDRTQLLCKTGPVSKEKPPHGDPTKQGFYVDYSL